MIIRFTSGQLEKLSTLFLNIAQALFIIAFAVSYFATGVEIIDGMKAFLVGSFFVYLSLELEKRKEVKQKK